MKKSFFIALVIIIVIALASWIYLSKNNSDDNSTIGIGSVDSSQCIALQGESKIVYSIKAFECWTNLAKEHRDATICELGFKEKYLQKCYENVSQYFNDVSMCDGLASTETFEGFNPTDAKVKCYIEFAVKNNWDTCQNPFLIAYRTLDNSKGSDFCYLTIVSRGNNLLGKKLTDAEITTLCGKISDEELSNSCLNYVGNPWQIPS